MATSTPPLLTAVRLMTVGDSIVLNAYQGIRATFIPDGGSQFEYSFVNDDEATAHDPLTAILVDALTTIDLTWPFILVTCNAGSGRVALI